ncbi:hypothetical protein AB0J43_45665 [Nonomuraea fuscirosea]
MIAFICGACGAVSTTRALGREHLIEQSGVLAVPVSDQKPEVTDPIAQAGDLPGDAPKSPVRIPRRVERLPGFPGVRLVSLVVAISGSPVRRVCDMLDRPLLGTAVDSLWR